VIGGILFQAYAFSSGKGPVKHRPLLPRHAMGTDWVLSAVGEVTWMMPWLVPERDGSGRF